jgi:hypothetical protein
VSFKRDFFCIWTNQVVCKILSWLEKFKSESYVFSHLSQVRVTNLVEQAIDFREPANFWLGPRAVSTLALNTICNMTNLVFAQKM